MKTHDHASQLNEYVDGTLDAAQVTAMEAHLAECVTCREEVHRLRELLQRVDALPRALEPPHDLWPAIDASLDPPVISPRRWMRPSWLAAAALLALAIGASVLLWSFRATAPPSFADAPWSPKLVAEFQRVDGEYARAVAELEEVLEVVRDSLAPETVAVVERNLRIIDAAILEAQRALEDDPGSREIADALSSRYEDKLELLRQVTRLAARS